MRIQRFEPGPPSTAITRFAMRQRFTFAERVAIETAADSDYEVRVFLKDLEIASYVDLSRQDVIDGMAIVEGKGLINSGRGSEILSVPIDPGERP